MKTTKFPGLLSRQPTKAEQLEKRNEQIAKRREAGTTVQELSEEFGLGKDHLKSILNKQGRCVYLRHKTIKRIRK